MSSATAVTATRSRSRVKVSEEVVAAGAVAGIVVLLAALTWRTWGDLGQDTGYDLVAASRVAHGALPYRDFFYYYGPLAPFTLGLATWLGGTGVAVAAAFGLVVTSAIVAVTYLLGRAIAGTRGAVAAATLTAAVAFMPTNFSFVLPHTESATLGTLLLLALLLALRRNAFVTVGVLCGLCTLTRLEVAAAAVVATIAWIVVRRPTPGRAARVVGPALAIPAVTYGTLAPVVGLHRLLLENLYPVATLRAAGNAVVRVHAPLTASSIARLGWETLAYALGAVVLLLVARRFGARVAAPWIVAAGVAVGLAAALARPASFQYWSGYAYLWLPAGAVAALVWAFRKRDADAAAEAAMLAVLAGTVYAAFQLQATRAQPAVYAAPLAALLLVRLHGRTAPAWLALLAAGALVVTVHLAHAKSAVVRGPGGAVASSVSDAPAYQGAVDWLTAHTRPGEPVLLAPQLTTLYALSGRTDPVPQISLLPGALPHRSDEAALIARLQRDRVRVAVIDRHAFREYGHTAFGRSFDRTLAAWIHRTFRHVAVVGGGSRTLDIWMRRTS